MSPNEDTKRKALDLLKRGANKAEVATQLKVHRTTIHRWSKELNQSTPIKKTQRAERSKAAIGGQVIRHPKFMALHVAKHPTDDATGSVEPVAPKSATKDASPSHFDTLDVATGATSKTLKNQKMTNVKSDSCNTLFPHVATLETPVAKSAPHVARQPVALSLHWLQVLQAMLIATFCLVATGFIIWESGEAQGGTAATVLSGLIEVGALGLAAIPLKGKQAVMKYIVLGLIGLYSVSLLCSASIAKSHHQNTLIHESKKDKELNKQLTRERMESFKAKEELIRESIASKRMELEALLQKGYVGASRKLSGDISDLEDKLLKLESPHMAMTAALDTRTEKIVFAGVFWLCAGRAILVLLNFFAASLLHRYIRFQGCGV